MKKFKNKKWISIALATTLAAAGISALAIACHDTKEKDGTQPENGKNAQPPKNGSSRNNQKQVIIQPKQPNQNNLDKKPVVTLDANTKLIKRTDNKYELKFNITNEENKLVKVELTPVISATSSTSSIFSDFATVSNQRVTAVFSNLDEKTNYLVKSINVYNSKQDNKPVKIELDSKTTSLKLTFDKPKVSTPAPSLQANQPSKPAKKKEANHKNKSTQKLKYTKETFDPKNNLPNFVKNDSDRKFIYNTLNEKLIGKADEKYSWFEKWNYDPQHPFYPGDYENTPEYIVKIYWLAAIYALETSYKDVIGEEEYNKIVSSFYKYLWTDVTKKNKKEYKGLYYNLDSAQKALKNANEKLEELFKEKKGSSPITQTETETPKNHSADSVSHSDNQSDNISIKTQPIVPPPVVNSNIRGGHVHGNPYGRNQYDTPKLNAGLTFANGLNETQLLKNGDKYKFDVKFDPSAIGYSASVTLASKEPNSEKTEGVTFTDDVEVTSADSITLEFDASDIEGMNLKKLYLLNVKYDKDGSNSSIVDLTSKKLVLTLPSSDASS